MSRAAIAGLVLLVAAPLAGCGSSSGSADESSRGGDPREPAPPAAIRIPPLEDRTISVEHLRRAVLQGIGHDYLSGTQVGPPRFGLCLQLGDEEAAGRT